MPGDTRVNGACQSACSPACSVRSRFRSLLFHGARCRAGSCRSSAAPGPAQGPASSEELVHDLGAGGDHPPQLPAVQHLGCPGGGVPGQPGDLLDADPVPVSGLCRACDVGLCAHAVCHSSVLLCLVSMQISAGQDARCLPAGRRRACGVGGAHEAVRGRRIVAEFFDIGQSERWPGRRRPQTAALVAALADPTAASTVCGRGSGSPSSAAAADTEGADLWISPSSAHRR